MDEHELTMNQNVILETRNGSLDNIINIDQWIKKE